MTSIVAGQTKWSEVTGDKPFMGMEKYITWSHFAKHQTDLIVQNIVRVHIEAGAKKVAVSLINAENPRAFRDCRTIAQEKSLGTVFCTDHGNFLILHPSQLKKLGSKEVEMVWNDDSKVSFGKVTCKDRPVNEYEKVIFTAYGIWGKKIAASIRR